MNPPPLTELVKMLGPLKDINMQQSLSPTLLKALIGHALPALGLADVACLSDIASRIFTDLKQHKKCVTLGQIIGNPAVIEFFNKYDSQPVWRILRCPRCARVIERNTRSPSPCLCGYDWADEKADLLAYACEHAKPGGLLEQFALLRKETHE